MKPINKQAAMGMVYNNKRLPKQEPNYEYCIRCKKPFLKATYVKCDTPYCSAWCDYYDNGVKQH